MISRIAARAKEDIGKERIQKGMRIAASAVKQKDCIIGMARGVAVRRTKREVMQLEFGERFTGPEAEIFENRRVFHRWPGGGGGGLREGPAGRSG